MFQQVFRQCTTPPLHLRAFLRAAARKPLLNPFEYDILEITVIPLLFAQRCDDVFQVRCRYISGEVFIQSHESFSLPVRAIDIPGQKHCRRLRWNTDDHINEVRGIFRTPFHSGHFLHQTFISQEIS